MGSGSARGRRARDEAAVHAGPGGGAARGGGRARGDARRDAGRLLLAAQPGGAGLRRAGRGCASRTCSCGAARSPVALRHRAGASERGLLEVAVAADACLAGDVQCVNVYSALGWCAAEAVDAAVLLHRPRDRRNGDGARPRRRAAAIAANAARRSAAAVLAPRVSDATSGSGTAASRTTREPCSTCASARSSPWRRGTGGSSPRGHPGARRARLPLSHMGRGPDEDPAFFAAAYAAGGSSRADGGAAARAGRRPRNLADVRRRRAARAAGSSAPRSTPAAAGSTPRRCTARRALAVGRARGTARGATVATKIWAHRRRGGPRAVPPPSRVVRAGRARAGAQPRRRGRSTCVARAGARRRAHRPPRRHALQPVRVRRARGARCGRAGSTRCSSRSTRRERECERDALPLAAELGIAVVVMRPLGAGAWPLGRPPPRPARRRSASSASRRGRRRSWWALSDERVDVVIPADDRSRPASAAGRVVGERRRRPAPRSAPCRLGPAGEQPALRRDARLDIGFARLHAYRRRQGDQAGRVPRRADAGGREASSSTTATRSSSRPAPGSGSAFPDRRYEAVGARIGDVDEVWEQSELLLKVKEPIESEYPRLREGSCSSRTCTSPPTSR